MTLAALPSAALVGIEAEPVEVEVDLAGGLPGWNIVGLAEASVREAKERVRAALVNTGFEFPPRRITVNLAPADRRKEGSHFDLPIAIGVLAASGQLPASDALRRFLLLAELSLDGRLRPVRGALALAWHARQKGLSVIAPPASAQEAALAGARAYEAETLIDVVRFFRGNAELAPSKPAPTPEDAPAPDLSEVRGQHQARRALEIAAAGGHHLLFVGPPGAGKSMLAERMVGILPPLNDEERLEVARIYSVAGDTSRPLTSHRPPFRAPHHTASDAAIVGGGSTPRPGEASKAHLGVLFLDELAEFRPRVLEALREPLESGVVRIARAAETIAFPARFQLVAAMNPCPCGHWGDPNTPCRCPPAALRRYRARISGPLRDRFDLRLFVPPVDRNALLQAQAGEPSEAVRKRVLKARRHQRERQHGKPNAQLTPRELARYAEPDREGKRLLENALRQMKLSARGYHRVLRVARTIADLEASEKVQAHHIAEALALRGDADWDAF